MEPVPVIVDRSYWYAVMHKSSVYGTVLESVHPVSEHVSIAAFSGDWRAAKRAERSIARSMGASRCSVEPVGDEGDDGRELVGSIRKDAFRVWWSFSGVHREHMLSVDADPWTREFAVRSYVPAALPRLLLSSPAVESVRCLTADRSPVRALLVTVLGTRRRGASAARVSRACTAVAGRLRLPFAGITVQCDPSGAARVSVVLADHDAVPYGGTVDWLGPGAHYACAGDAAVVAVHAAARR